MNARNLPPAERLPVGSKVEIVPQTFSETWPGGVGEIVEIKPENGGYLVKHKIGTFGWAWHEVIPARPWWRRLFWRYPPGSAVHPWRLEIQCRTHGGGWIRWGRWPKGDKEPGC